jgi:hypothetical protein
VFGVRRYLVVPLRRVAKAETPALFAARESLPDTVLHAELVIRMVRRA